MGSWASLFSGGKDSSYALHQAREAGVDVTHLLTVHPPPNSFMYHVPATGLAGLAAESIGLPLTEIESTVRADDVVDVGAQGDREIEPLEAALRTLAGEADLDGVVAGAIESAYQTTRLRAMCDRLGLQLNAPLWQKAPEALATDMLTAGFEILIVQVAADGFDASWLGRTLDRDAISELRILNERRGVHLLGEGGEYETVVTDGPHMARRIEFESTVAWKGDRGHLEIQDAWLS